jgi:hypothetical protein
MHNPPVTWPKSSRTRARWLAVAALAVSASLAGCGDATDDRPAKWSFIAATIMEPTCATASCHSEMVQRAGVDLHERNIGYRSLVDRLFVRPGMPAASPVLNLMRGQGSIRMPPDFPLPESDIRLVEAWIMAGAANE